jgi:hypothetical protein
MAKPDFKRGDSVRFTREWYGIKVGTVGKLLRGPREVCVDHHKGYYEWVVEMESDGKEYDEVECAVLEKADAIERLGNIKT